MQNVNAVKMSRRGCWRTSGTWCPAFDLEKHCAVGARAGADGGLCGGLRLRTRGRLSGSWRRVLEDLGGKDGLHDSGSVYWFGRARKEGGGAL